MTFQGIVKPIYVDIELVNGEDLALARRHIIDEKKVKRLSINILVDARTYMLAINETIQGQIQFPVVGKKEVRFADGRIVECDIVAPVEIKYKYQLTVCRAIVLPGDSQPTFGSVPFDAMNRLIYPLYHRTFL